MTTQIGGFRPKTEPETLVTPSGRLITDTSDYYIALGRRLRSAAMRRGQRRSGPIWSASSSRMATVMGEEIQRGRSARTRPGDRYGSYSSRITLPATVSSTFANA